MHVSSFEVFRTRGRGTGIGAFQSSGPKEATRGQCHGFLVIQVKENEVNNRAELLLLELNSKNLERNGFLRDMSCGPSQSSGSPGNGGPSSSTSSSEHTPRDWRWSP